MEVHEAGGGINFTVEHTKKATEEELEALFLERTQRMLRAGTIHEVVSEAFFNPEFEFIRRLKMPNG